MVGELPRDNPDIDDKAVYVPGSNIKKKGGGRGRNRRRARRHGRLPEPINPATKNTTRHYEFMPTRTK